MELVTKAILALSITIGGLFFGGAYLLVRAINAGSAGGSMALFFLLVLAIISMNLLIFWPDPPPKHKAVSNENLPDQKPAQEQEPADASN